MKKEIKASGEENGDCWGERERGDLQENEDEEDKFEKLRVGRRERRLSCGA